VTLKCNNVFDRKRRQMQRDNANGEPVNEKFLFHGTSKNAVDAICANNFDWRVCGSHGTVYGQGNSVTVFQTCIEHKSPVVIGSLI